jgi:broad specificity phosphatase PhoE
MVTMLLVRHAHTAANRGGGAQMSGWTDLPLSEEGREQLAQLRRAATGGPSFAAILSSPLQRALQTALALREAGLGEVQTVEALREIHCGRVDGLDVEVVQREFPLLWARNLRQDDADFRWPGGESYREFRERCTGALRALCRAHPGARLALVTHAGFISQVVGALCGHSPARWSTFRPDNIAVTEIRWNGDSGALVAFNQPPAYLRGGSLTRHGRRLDASP